MRLIVTAGQRSDVSQAAALIAGLTPTAVRGDTGYDSDQFVAAVRATGAAVVTPPLRCRKVLREYDAHTYKERNKVERFFGWVKQYRRVATRYEKTARNLLAFAHVASIMHLLT